MIQYLLEINKGKNCEEIYKSLIGKVYDMSTHKYASNIIERCLYFGTQEQKNNIIDEILLREDYLHDSLISLVKDRFGNYVVQKMIENSDKRKREEIISKILNSYFIKRKEGYTKHVLNYIENLGYNILGEDSNSKNNVTENNVNNINKKSENYKDKIDKEDKK